MATSDLIKLAPTLSSHVRIFTMQVAQLFALLRFALLNVSVLVSIEQAIMLWLWFPNSAMMRNGSITRRFSARRSENLTQNRSLPKRIKTQADWDTDVYGEGELTTYIPLSSNHYLLKTPA